jgi:peptidoglycan-associated lipoprotein
VAVNFEAMRSNTVPGYNFWMQGGAIQVTSHITRNWGIASDVSGLHTGELPHNGVGLDLITAVFGPRYMMTLPNGHWRLYGQIMGGTAHGKDSLFPNPKGATSSANGVALLMGGGLDFPTSRRVAVRAIDASWLRTSLSNGTTTVQNSLRLGSGVVFRF